MDLEVSAFRLFILGWPMLLAACASSDVDKYSGSDPVAISGTIEVLKSEITPDLYVFKGPSIDTRAGYGTFAKGMLRGGSNLGSSVYLEGSQQADGGVSHRLVTTFQYTNLGGVYREYHHAAVDGVDSLTVEPASRHKQYTVNGVIMTETVAVAIDDAALRSMSSRNLTLRLSTDSGNLDTVEIPANYLRAYLLAVDRNARTGNSP